MRAKRLHVNNGVGRITPLMGLTPWTYSTRNPEWDGENVHNRLFSFCAHNHDKTSYILVFDCTHVYFNTEPLFLKDYPPRAANEIPRVFPAERNTHDCTSSTFNRCVSVFVKADPGTICVGAHVCRRAAAHRRVALIVYKISRQRSSIFFPFAAPCGENE